MSKRLLTDFVPSNYQVYLDIDRQAKTIKGITTITGDARQKQIAVNQKYLKVDEVTVNGQAVSFKVDDQAETISLPVEQPGAVTVQIAYHTDLTDTMMGIYPSYYQVNGQQKELIE